MKRISMKAIWCFLKMLVENECSVKN